MLQWSIIKKQALLLLRYPVNTAAEVVTVYIFFLLFFYGGLEAARNAGVDPAGLGGTFDGLIIGWFLWTMAQRAYLRLATTISLESQWGTLEQLYLSPFGFGRVIAASVVAHLLESLTWGTVILGLMLATTSRTLDISLLTVVPLSLLSILSVVGIGFVFAGLALIYKRVGNVRQLMQFVLIGLVAAPIAEYWPLRLLPLVQGSDMLQRAMRDGVLLWEFPLVDLGLLTVVGVAYALGGYLIFQRCSTYARKLGVMGHY